MTVDTSEQPPAAPSAATPQRVEVPTEGSSTSRRTPGSNRAYRYDWARFEDWAAAFEHLALPAHPLTLARYLDANPAAPATHRRWVTAINATHRGQGFIEPGRADRVRMLLRPNLIDRIRERRAAACAVLPGIPATGWPQGMFGRRDALIVVLAEYAGVSLTQIRRLNRSDVWGDSEGLHIVGYEPIPAPTDCDPQWTPTAVWARWARVQAVADRRISTRSLVEAMLGGGLDVLVDESKFPPIRSIREGRDGPLVGPIDRWGHTPYDPARLSTTALGEIVRGHLGGAAPAHATPLPRAWRPDYRPAAEVAATPLLVVEDRGPVLDYDTAVARRRAGIADLKSATSILDDVDDQADLLMQRLLDLLEGEQRE